MFVYSLFSKKYLTIPTKIKRKISWRVIKKIESAKGKDEPAVNRKNLSKLC